jgi:hypothetical protein
VGDSQLTVLGACLTNEVLSGVGIKKNDNGVSVQGKHTNEDLLTLGNVFHGGVVDVTGLCNDHLLLTTWRVSDVALSSVILRRGALSSEVARATTFKAGVAGGSSSNQWHRQV